MFILCANHNASEANIDKPIQNKHLQQIQQEILNSPMLPKINSRSWPKTLFQVKSAAIRARGSFVTMLQ